ncbi:MAG: hypothetical protein K9J83_01130 [Desulfarculaceae bacterium]|nr:hypothetical protein [Desulfarculaceae bacterium]
MNEPTVVKEIKLDNGLVLMITDCSKKVGQDAWLVSMKAKIVIPVDESTLSDVERFGIDPADAVSKLGEQVSYEYKAERNFIMEQEKDALFQSMVDDFMSTNLMYLSNPRFASKFIVKEYRDLTDKKRLKRFR